MWLWCMLSTSIGCSMLYFCTTSLLCRHGTAPGCRQYRPVHTGQFRQYRPSIDLLHQVRPQGALGLSVQASTGQYGPGGASTAKLVLDCT